MSALEQAPFAVTDRRTAPRIRINGNVAAHLGRRDAALVDISASGARVRHSFSVSRGAVMRLAFNWHSERFAANAEVLAVRVFALGDGKGGATIFESRLRFAYVAPEAASALERILADITGRDLRNWVANLQGWRDEHAAVATPRLRMSYVRCRLVRERWSKKWTHDAVQPDDGFTVPATFDATELDELCRTFVACDDDGRQLIRTMAAEVVVTASAR